MYGVWQMPTCSAKDEREAAEYLNEFLKQQRLYPYQIVSIRGNYSPQKLFDMAQGKGNIKGSKVKVIEADFL